jgi:hypothetical protein
MKGLINRWSRLPRHMINQLTIRLRSPPAPKSPRGVDLISDALPFGRLWYGEPNAASNAVDYAKFRSPARCRDSGLRCSSQRDRIARARGQPTGKCLIVCSEFDKTVRNLTDSDDTQSGAQSTEKNFPDARAFICAGHSPSKFPDSKSTKEVYWYGIGWGNA